MKDQMMLIVFILTFFTNTVGAIVIMMDPCSVYPSAPNLNDSAAVSTYVNLTVNCAEAFITVKLSRCAILGLGYSGNVSLFNETGQKHTDPECIPTVSDDQTTLNLNFSTSFYTCASKVLVTPGNIQYTYKLRNSEYSIAVGAVIIRQVEFLEQFSCTYQSQYNVTYGSGLSVSRKAINVTRGTISGTFSQILVMYNDSTFANALSNNQTQSLTFVVPQFIYFAMVSNADPTQYIMQATDCWVTETNDASAAVKYDIISAGCAVADSVYIDANKVFMNYQSSQVRIGFRSFVWSTGGVSLFVHCTINMCDLRLPNNCTAAPSCASVGRRSITSDTPKNIWSYGPIFVKGPPTACDTFNGGCSHHCIPLGDGKVECSCPVNYVINTDGQTCRDLLLDPVVGDAKIRAGLGKIVELSDSMDISTVATTVLLGVVFLVAIVVAIYVIGQARNRAWLSGTPHLTL